MANAILNFHFDYLTTSLILTIIDITTTIIIKDIITTPNLEEDVPLYASFERGSNGHGALNSGRYVKHRT